MAGGALYAIANKSAAELIALLGLGSLAFLNSAPAAGSEGDVQFNHNGFLGATTSRIFNYNDVKSAFYVNDDIQDRNAAFNVRGLDSGSTEAMAIYQAGTGDVLARFMDKSANLLAYLDDSVFELNAIGINCRNITCLNITANNLVQANTAVNILNGGFALSLITAGLTGSSKVATFPNANITVAAKELDNNFTVVETFAAGIVNVANAALSTDGAIWNDSTQKAAGVFESGIKQMLTGCIFTQTADKTIANTTTETSMVGTGVGGLTLPANFFVAGKTIRISMSGVYSTVAVTGDTVTIKIKYGSTVLASKATTALVTGGTNLAWFAEALITCRSVGSSGTVQVSGGVRYQIAGSAIVENELNNGAAKTTLNTTTSNLLDVTVTHSAANASNTVKSLVGTFEIIN